MTTFAPAVPAARTAEPALPAASLLATPWEGIAPPVSYLAPQSPRVPHGDRACAALCTPWCTG